MNYNEVSKLVDATLNNPPLNSVELARLKRVIKLVSEGSEVYIVMGKRGDYIAIPKTFCSCKDFEINVIMRSRRRPCYHLIGLELAIKNELIKEVRVSEEDLVNIVFECVYEGKSRTLRRVLTVSTGGGSSPL